ncbi:DNA gyrase subunit A [Acetanaerobacterium elongatum]|uniref:DNA gyrase subunit A n=1 Tax=Acetanaerobacterium elongatum TaxID=258515 RepID=A0A1H0GKA4_9FIRM|nr:DNA gyrase subunit A [Acetanaerobacterium elongatum]SDO07387.1 DNA gyrase subunit A [Acetanaerobacterium elongatum]
MSKKFEDNNKDAAFLAEGGTNKNVISIDIEKEMRKSFLDYSMSVIVSRALPDVRDGLKPVHRRILYTMFEKGLQPDKAYRKCADTVGAVLGAYHPHGDASVYDALVRLAQDFSLRYPLVDGHGNFGSIDGDPPAAYRYTEARMSKMSTHMLTDIDKETVDFVPNYDDRLKEPVVLPSRFPNLLVNGCTGIAVGMATNIPPHNLGEVVAAVDLLIDNPNASLDELMECIKGPDFPTGGIIMGRSGIRAAYATGRGKITLRSRCEIEEEKNGRFRIVVTEIPYMVNKARLIEYIADLVKDKRIEGISDLRDESDREGLRIVIELKREANPQIVLNQLYSLSQLQDTVGVIMLALENGTQPKVMTLKEILQNYIDFQQQIVTRRTIFDLKKAKEREHILEGLKLAIDFIDEVIAIIRASKDQPSAKVALMERFGLDDIQASAIVAMRLGQLSGLERVKIEEELAEILKKVAELEGILADVNKVRAIVKAELGVIRDKYKDERRTEIQTVSGELDIEDLIPVEDCVVTLTHYGYIKRQPADVYKAQRRGGRGISGMTRRDEDFVEELFISSSHDFVMFFTDRGRVYRLKCYEIPESSRTARGTNIVNLLPLEQDEKVQTMIRIPAFEEGKYLVMVTTKGIIKRTEVTEYDTARKGGVIAINLDDDDTLAWVRLTDGHSDLIVGTRNGMAIRFDENDARPLGRTARGVRAIQLDEGDVVVGMARVRENGTLLTVTEKGQGRRTEFDEYRQQTRAGKGVINYRVDEEKGAVAGIRTVNDDDDAILITNDGIIIRIPVEQIAVQSRYAGGVRVMRVEGDTRLVSMARAPHEDTSDTDSTDEDENLEEALEEELTEGNEE